MDEDSPRHLRWMKGDRYGWMDAETEGMKEWNKQVSEMNDAEDNQIWIIVTD